MFVWSRQQRNVYLNEGFGNTSRTSLCKLGITSFVCVLGREVLHELFLHTSFSLQRARIQSYTNGHPTEGRSRRLALELTNTAEICARAVRHSLTHGIRQVFLMCGATFKHQLYYFATVLLVLHPSSSSPRNSPLNFGMDLFVYNSYTILRHLTTSANYVCKGKYCVISDYSHKE